MIRIKYENDLQYNFAKKVPNISISLGFWLMKKGNGISDIQSRHKFQDHARKKFLIMAIFNFLR